MIAHPEQQQQTKTKVRFLPGITGAVMRMQENRLRELREARGMALRKLSAVSGVAVSTLHGIEAYGAYARPQTWTKIADALGVEVWELQAPTGIPRAEEPIHTHE
jgi:transcriptional regulator with XRE-family HTH domain